MIYRPAIHLAFLFALTPALIAGEAAPQTRVYKNTLTPIKNAAPLMADYPHFIQPIQDFYRFEGPPLIEDAEATIDVRAWRYSHNARGIVEIPNRLDGKKTAIIMVHPWGVDDGQGWKTPEPNGVALFCTPEKNAMGLRHATEVVQPFIARCRDDVGLVLFSMRGDPDDVRMQLYRSIERTPTSEERQAAQKKLTEMLTSFDYHAKPLPTEFTISLKSPLQDHIKLFPTIDSGPHYNCEGFWQLPIPVMKPIKVHDNDVVFYDNQGYPALKQFLSKQGIEHILLCGYATDLCVCATTAGYRNLKNDFNVFLVGDATQASCPANSSAVYSTNQAISQASMELFITQASWVKN
ncbi:isochorismatase family protein [Planctomicrobium sp. SH664]|uniref:isochorismatase family protein n=1 Tax=Planctomicrobium sp. SH664 TaxID=3448125 RepID=UPI003F5C55E0